MRADRPSQTAMATAFLRALHLAADEPPPVFEDRLAEKFLPPYQQRFLRRLAALPRVTLALFRQRRDGLTRMRAQVLVRSRYAEDALAEAREAGAGRYVVLAAGLDTFAWRQSGSTDPVPVIEVDHPATQAWKIEQLSRAADAPARVGYRAVDFERQRLTDVLDRPEQPQFISWLGTSYYLTRRALAETLTALAKLSPPGSRLVLDYWDDSNWPDTSTLLLWGTRVATALQQEPMRCFLEPRELERLAAECGWRVREQLTAQQQNRRYLAGRRDRLEVPKFAHLAQLER